MTRSATNSNHSVCGLGLRQVLDSAKSLGTPMFAASGGTPWPIQILVAVGVPFLACFEAYEDMAGNEERELMGGVEAQRRYVDGVNTVLCSIRQGVLLTSIDPYARLLHIYMTVDLLWAWVAAANESPRGVGTDNYASKEVSNLY